MAVKIQKEEKQTEISINLIFYEIITAINRWLHADTNSKIQWPSKLVRGQKESERIKPVKQ